MVNLVQDNQAILATKKLPSDLFLQENPDLIFNNWSRQERMDLLDKMVADFLQKKNSTAPANTINLPSEI